MGLRIRPVATSVVFTTLRDETCQYFLCELPVDQAGMALSSASRDTVGVMVKPLSVDTFPFGRPVLPRPPSASTEKRVFMLGAYPSALHVAWRPPGGKPIKAMAVDNEPDPFWNGKGENEIVARWKKSVGFRDGEWGEVAGVGVLNGSSGQWVDDNVLVPLKAGRDDAWITDCLDTYFSSTAEAHRIADTYEPFARSMGLPSARLPAHPTEFNIVDLTDRRQTNRLRQELSDAEPDIVVTLGNAALRVFRGIAGKMVDIWKLRADSSYGAEVFASFEGRRIVWLPLAYPAAPRVYQELHAGWRRTMMG